MSPQEFMEKWSLDRNQLAILLGMSKGSINHWLSRTSPRQPPDETLLRLKELDLHFSILKLCQTENPTAWEVFHDSQDC